ncbi:uncharacterized protein TEOVI_000906000 [Trypanosoma equiperdum]|uniref:Nascent polypeptide-associated complex subunit alpha-like UBA domain-containing protein n=4 Tax=Trypanozoon TaxID=39700 RepID=Q57UQ4_TRYB2|nr:hypothetical protein, conserved [Trypanosoma brucei gambiense DAL972]XP_011774843.1 hypothetical protein, conserved [Trypanosoma brucei gambiense DAL972]XP_846047.1 hypothetical protein, conserved [Trypanosoma brucei brucei TREU927]XP_846048.1 hypothetical protein, conserved [Trypanosoma brucei brucei TREU927]AAX70664.1 hypothetical protein, conserved [Trypanosoma brucei]RHW71330.1 hypothetical protein DPX39_070052600 [Trypanosoma brucei equiperdum]SCU68229.1 hypothetical protein, conserve|eukprot:XP_011774839.1 hypothetical protein, conserved [Trypanosoma brucei gambiense DAL972]
MTRQSDVQKSMRTISDGAEKAVEVRKYDEKAVQQRMQKLYADVAKKKLAEKKRADELAQIPVSEEDVQLLVRECGWEAQVAQQKLRERNGSVVAVLRDVAGLPKAKASSGTS